MPAPLHRSALSLLAVLMLVSACGDAATNHSATVPQASQQAAKTSGTAPAPAGDRALAGATATTASANALMAPPQPGEIQIAPAMPPAAASTHRSLVPTTQDRL